MVDLRARLHDASEGVGPLAYLLRSRFFIGEVDYRGAV